MSMRLIEEKELRLKSDIEENIEMLIDWIKKIENDLERIMFELDLRRKGDWIETSTKRFKDNK